MYAQKLKEVYTELKILIGRPMEFAAKYRIQQ
jgi:hypothetical protein